MVKRIPLAKNSLVSKTLFRERNYYKHNILSSKEYPGLIDFWTLKFREYGKVNLSNQKIRINERFLKKLPSDEPANFYAVNFVADAFAGLKKYCHSAAFGMNRIIRADSRYAIINPQAQNMWTSIDDGYNAYIRVHFEMFISRYMQNHRHNRQVKDINTFLELFLQFSKEIGPNAPVTKVGYIESVYSGVNHNGLIIEIASANHAVDFAKWKWTQDVGFDFWRRGCAMHGFWVDRNAPWRIVANIESKSMLRYMKKYDIHSIKELFDVYFVRVFSDEIRDFKKYLYRLYYSFIQHDPVIVEKTFLPNHKKTRTTRTRRATLRETDFYHKYGDRYWVRYWFMIRIAELGVVFSQHRREQILKTAYKIQIELDLPSALEYLSRVLQRATGHTGVPEKAFIERKTDRQIIVHS